MNTYRASNNSIRIRMLNDALLDVIQDSSARRNCAIAESVYSWGELLDSSRYFLIEHVKHIAMSPKYLAWKNRNKKLSGE